MPRSNSQDRSVNDTISSSALQDINEDIDDIYAEWSDRLRVVAAASAIALKVDIGTWSFQVWSAKWSYWWWTDISVTDDATNYIMIDSSGTIQQSTSARNNDYARLAVVTCVSGAITSIVSHKIDAYWWNVSADYTRKTITANQSALNGEWYLVNSASLVTLTLPTVAAVGEKIAVKWIWSWWRKIAQNAWQSIKYSNHSTTAWTWWSLDSNESTDVIILECFEANTKREVISFTWQPQVNWSENIMKNVIELFKATDAKITWISDVLKFLQPDQIRDHYWMEVDFWYFTVVADDDNPDYHEIVTHDLWVTPKVIIMFWNDFWSRNTASWRRCSQQGHFGYDYKDQQNIFWHNWWNYLYYRQDWWSAAEFRFIDVDSVSTTEIDFFIDMSQSGAYWSTMKMSRIAFK